MPDIIVTHTYIIQCTMRKHKLPKYNLRIGSSKKHSVFKMQRHTKLE